LTARHGVVGTAVPRGAAASPGGVQRMACILLLAMRVDRERAVDAREREAFCIVERGQRRLALPAGAVRRVLSSGPVMPVPAVPAHVVGLVSDRGVPLPVVSVDAWIDQPARACRPGDPVLVLECDGLRFGLVVDRFAGVRRLPAAAAGAAAGARPVVQSEIPAEGGPVALLDPEALAAAATAAALVADEEPRVT
jgi:chemotaxis signal transduction protein